MGLELWYQGHSSHNVPGIPCPSVNTYHSKPAESGTYTITGTGGNRTVNLLFTKNGSIGTAPAGESGFPVSLSTALPGYNVFGIGNPYTPLRATVWNKK